MKRLLDRGFLFSIAAMMLFLPLAAQEKEQSDMCFLKHLTLGGEIGTMGIGMEVATPLRPNIRLRAGIMALPFTTVFAYDSHQDLLKLVSAKGNSYDYMVARDERIMKALLKGWLPYRSSSFPNTVELKEKLLRIEGKVLVDFYPKKGSWFYFTVGAYIGNMDQWHMKGEIDPVYAKAVSVVNDYLPEDDKMRLLSCSSSPNYYSEVEVGSDGKIDYSYRVLPVKPYVGIGFGRMLPKRKLGCHFDLGVLYRGRWRVHSDGYHRDDFDPFFNWTSIYCVASLRLTGRLF